MVIRGGVTLLANAFLNCLWKKTSPFLRSRWWSSRWSQSAERSVHILSTTVLWTDTIRQSCLWGVFFRNPVSVLLQHLCIECNGDNVCCNWTTIQPTVSVTTPERFVHELPARPRRQGSWSRQRSILSARLPVFALLHVMGIFSSKYVPK